MRRWRETPAFWRVLTLVLAGLPQLLSTEHPFVGTDPADHGEEVGRAPADTATVVMIATSRSPLALRLLEYALESGLVLLLAAVVLVLPGERGRRVRSGAAAALAVLGLALGYAGMSALDSSDLSMGYLLVLSPFYLLAAVTLVIAERRTAPRQAEDETPTSDQP